MGVENVMETGVECLTCAIHELFSLSCLCTLIQSFTVPIVERTMYHEYNLLQFPLSGEERRVCGADDACSYGLHSLHPVNLLL